MTTEASTTPFEGEVDDELHTPEVLAPGEEVIDGDFIIDSKGLKRLRDGRLLPGQALNPNGRPKGSGTGLRYREFKQSMVLAFHQNGGTAWLARWGLQNPSQFFRLMSRMLPHEFQGETDTQRRGTTLDDASPYCSRRRTSGSGDQQHDPNHRRRRQRGSGRPGQRT